MKNPILITGCARSGTSMTAGVINYCGAFGGNMAGPNRYNAKGMFENRTIVDSMIKPFLKSIGADPMGQNPLPTLEAIKGHDSEKWKQRFLDIMIKQGYIENKHTLMYKGAKMCLMWLLWHKAFPDAKWIIVRRSDKEIINSCMKTGFMSKYKDTNGWQSWIDEHKKRFKEMHDEGLNIREVYPKDMISGNFKCVKETVKWLGLEWNSDKVLDFITPALWSNIKRKSEGGI